MIQQTRDIARTLSEETQKFWLDRPYWVRGDHGPFMVNRVTVHGEYFRDTGVLDYLSVMFDFVAMAQIHDDGVRVEFTGGELTQFNAPWSNPVLHALKRVLVDATDLERGVPHG